MNDDSYGNTRDAALGARRALPRCLLRQPDFAAFARLLGGHGIRVTRGKDVLPALRDALDQDLPSSVEVVQDQMYGLPPGLLPPAAR